jgi:hypothetical protein
VISEPSVLLQPPVLRVITASLGRTGTAPRVQKSDRALDVPFVADNAQESAGFRITPESLGGEASRPGVRFSARGQQKPSFHVILHPMLKGKPSKLKW